MIVVDASVLANMLAYEDERGRKAREVLGGDTEWTAPEHWKKIGESQATRAVERLPRLGVDTVCVDELLSRMWQLRDDISAYDAPYVALAASRRLTLVTADSRLATAAARHCQVELAR